MRGPDIQIIGVPIGIGGGHPGTAHGPRHAREAGLLDVLTNRLPNAKIEDLGDIAVDQSSGQSRLKTAADWCQLLRNHTHDVVKRDALALVVGGDHSLAAGSIAGAISARRQLGHSPPGVLWLDAHTDINTHLSTPSGNPHGMSAAALTGFHVDHLSTVVGDDGQIDTERMVFVGARDVDPGEKVHLEQAGINVFSSELIRTEGVETVLQQALEIVSPNHEPFCLSFDIDVIDPVHAPGVDTGVSDGLDLDQIRAAMEQIGSHAPLLLVDAVELNPEKDINNQTAELLISCLDSLLTTNVSRPLIQ